MHGLDEPAAGRRQAQADAALSVRALRRASRRARRRAARRRARPRAAFARTGGGSGSSPPAPRQERVLLREKLQREAERCGRTRLSRPPLERSALAHREKTSREGFPLSPRRARSSRMRSSPSSRRYSSNLSASWERNESAAPVADHRDPGRADARRGPPDRRPAVPSTGVSPESVTRTNLSIKAGLRGTGSPRKLIPTRSLAETVDPTAGRKLDGSIQKSWAKRAPPRRTPRTRQAPRGEGTSALNGHPPRRTRPASRGRRCRPRARRRRASGEVGLPVADRGRGRNTRGLDEDLHALEHPRQRLDQLRVRDEQDLLHVLLHDRERQLAGRRDPQAVGDRRVLRHRDALAGFERAPRCRPRSPARRRRSRSPAAGGWPPSPSPRSGRRPRRTPRRQSRSGTSSSSSTALVAWPAMTSSSSYGGTRRAPRSRQISSARSSRLCVRGRRARPRRRSRGSRRSWPAARRSA